MPVEFKDYYRTLGVDRKATGEDIKQAFRKKARLYHPDVAKDRPGSESKFKEINEANEVLSDPDKRRKYDELGENWNHPEREAPPGGFAGGAEGGAEFHFDGTGFSDFFEQFFSNRSRPREGFAPFGRRDENETGGERTRQRGQDIEGDILVTLDEVLQGSSRTIRLQRTDPLSGRSASQTLLVKIPPGVREGQLIRLAGKGQEGIGGGEPGNLYLRVAFAKHPEFRVRGCDLHCDLELTPWEAVLGGAVDMRTLDGTVSLKIPAGTVADRQFRLRGKGLPNGAGARGDLYAGVIIQVPTQLTPEQKILWAKLAAESPFNPRSRS